MKKTILIIIVISGLLLLGWLGQGCHDPAPGQLLSPEELRNTPKYTSLEDALKEPEKVYKLDLSDKQLTTLPKSITKLTNLQWLNLANNQLTTLPKSVTKLTNLQVLNLQDNNLITLPGNISKLTNLQVLRLYNNQLTTLPESIGKLTNLQELNLYRNQLTTLPESITKLTNLQDLNLILNQLTTLPESIAMLTNLQRLDLRKNQLTTLPESIGKLTNLQELLLDENQLTTLPESISKLTNLQVLYLQENQLATLPENISKLTNLQELNLYHNKLTTLPESIGNLTNLQSLNLTANQLTEEEKARIKKLLPNVKNIFFSPDEKKELTKEQLLSKLLNAHEFENAKIFIQTEAINLNDFIKISKGRTWAGASSILANIIAHSCDAEITKFLLAQGFNPNLPSITVFIPEYSGEEIPENFDIKKDDLSGYRYENCLIENYPLTNSLNCDDSTSFYLLINAGANQDNFILQGAIKWSDTLLIKKSIAIEVAVNFVPNTNDVKILKLLIPITDGKQYGEIGYGEGGDMFESDLMKACDAGKKELVWFMLKTGSEPNECIPVDYRDGKRFNPDENGFLPALTALSIAKEKYEMNKKNIAFTKGKENYSMYIEKEKDFEEIIKLLKKYGAKEIDKCPV